MALPRDGHLYALTSLQIGDIQSYVSRLFLLVAYEGLKLVFLVDNGPWTINTRPSRPAELWQLMVNKSRGSPFANRLRDFTSEDAPGQQGFVGRGVPDSKPEDRQEKQDGWPSFLVALHRSCMERTQGKKPSHGLYGCVAFEVAWSDVRGINYSNELQTDTCVSLEVRVMTKREFDSLAQAQACYATILSGSKDAGPKSTVSKKSGANTTATIIRCKGPDNSLQGLVPERSRAARVHLNDVSVGVRPPGALDKKHIRRRQLDETPRHFKPNSSSATLISELSRAYINSLASRFSEGLDPISVGSLPPEYFTPPSSPGGGQVLQNLFKNYPRQHKDSKTFRIMPVNDHIESQTVAESRILKIKQPVKYSSSVDNGSGDNLTATYGRNQKSLTYNSFDRVRPFACSKCRLMSEGMPLRDRAQDCVKCRVPAEARQDSVYVHPDRLIAPAETYRDTLILFRFSEPLLPFELRRIITADRRLLKMLESGLPPWVIFLQSYPILCHLYRPWMRPLCGTIYYLISIITVLIGFYDLYKNVPVLKATAAHICGPLFEWIEEWGMVSRLKYLGTMLFLQNCEKAFEWAVAATRASRQVSMLLMRPVLEPLISFGEMCLPLWTGMSYGVQMVVQFVYATCASMFLGISSMFGFLTWPFIAFLTTVWNLGIALVYPVFSAIWAVFIFPIQMVRLFCSLMAALSFEVMESLQHVWLGIHDAFQLFLASGSPALQSLKIAKSSAPSPSMWRTLWNDILSKVFHAVNGIVKGLSTFVTACNRHRLSIYNQVVEFLYRVSHMLKTSRCAAVAACQQVFRPPNPNGEGHGVVSEEMESEQEEPAQFSSEPSPSIRHRSRGYMSSPPLLLMQGEGSTTRRLKL